MEYPPRFVFSSTYNTMNPKEKLYAQLCKLTCYHHTISQLAKVKTSVESPRS